jgi:hypothetical protein
MKNVSRKALVCIMLTGLITLGAFAQKKDTHEEEPRPTNLQVLPKDISHDSLIAVMHEYSRSLGVHCNFCHARSETDSTHLDFASDANGKKKVARYMMHMTAEINEKYFAEANYKSTTMMVSCYTCHHGQKEPERLKAEDEKE